MLWTGRKMGGREVDGSVLTTIEVYNEGSVLTTIEVYDEGSVLTTIEVYDERSVEMPVPHESCVNA